MMDGGSWDRNTKRSGGASRCARTHTQTHTRLFIELATGAAEQINDLTSQLARSATEEMAPTGPLLPLLSLPPSLPHTNHPHTYPTPRAPPRTSAPLWSNSKVFCAVTPSDSCLPASSCHMYVAFASCSCTSQSRTRVRVTFDTMRLRQPRWSDSGGHFLGCFKCFSCIF